MEELLTTCHPILQGAALTWYVICSLFTSSFILHFVICVVLIAFDFWTIKNVSGRRLVGMRWWNETDQEGESLWRFESLDQQVRGHLFQGLLLEVHRNCHLDFKSRCEPPGLGSPYFTFLAFLQNLKVYSRLNGSELEHSVRGFLAVLIFISL